MTNEPDLFDDIEDLLEPQRIPEDDKAKMLANLADHYQMMETTIAHLEHVLELEKEKFRRLREDLIPEKMMELGIKKMVLTDGSTLSYNEFYAGKVIDDGAYDWLEANGYADAVKRELKFEASRTDPAGLNALIACMNSIPKAFENTSVKEKQAIHHMTLGSAIRSLTKQGKELPQNLIETFIGNRATLKRGKDNG